MTKFEFSKRVSEGLARKRQGGWVNHPLRVSGEKSTINVNLHITPSEKLRWMEMAKELGLNLSETIRTAMNDLDEELRSIA